MNDNLSSHNSADYDNEISKTIPYYSSFHSETIDLVKSIAPSAEYWLDTGCGTGSLIQKALKEFPETRFYLSDPSEEMLQICKSKIENPLVTFLGNFATADIAMPTKPDVITAIQCHHYMDYDERKTATRHCYNLLQDGGLYVTFENIRLESDAGTNDGLNRWRNYQLRQGRNTKVVDKHLSRFDKEFFPIKISEHIELLKNVGFKVVELFWLSNMQAGFYGIKES